MQCDDCGMSVRDYDEAHRFQNADGNFVANLCGACCPRCQTIPPRERAGRTLERGTHEQD